MKATRTHAKYRNLSRKMEIETRRTEEYQDGWLQHEAIKHPEWWFQAGEEEQVQVFYHTNEENDSQKFEWREKSGKFPRNPIKCSQKYSQLNLFNTCCNVGLWGVENGPSSDVPLVRNESKMKGRIDVPTSLFVRPHALKCSHFEWAMFPKFLCGLLHRSYPRILK